mgnify:CR=1 FL=1
MTKIYSIYLTLLLLFIYTSSVAENKTSESIVLTSPTVRQIVRIDFTMPNGFVRHLALGFIPSNNATDGYDYGYDALNMDTFPDDLNWIIENDRYVIQGVGTFDDSKKYPLGMFLSNSGTIQIALDTLENFDTSIDLFIYDSVLDTYTQINNSNYAANISKGDYLDRFYLAFKDESQADEFANNSLSTDAFNLENTRVNYLSNTKELYINTHNNFIIETINIYNLLGQEIYSLNHVNSKLVKIPLEIKQNKYGIVILKTDEGESLSKKIALN